MSLAEIEAELSNRAMLLMTVLAADAVLGAVPVAPHHNLRWVLSSTA